MARLGQTVNFGEAAAVLAGIVGVGVSEATLRRCTYAAGQAALTGEAEELAQLLAAAGEPEAAGERDAQPTLMQVSIDATKVPLVGGQWTDAKLGVFAELAPGEDAEGAFRWEATKLSYAARWEPAEQFGQTLTLEAERRELEQATLVISPNDGADWIQGNLDLLAPAAVRVLDEPHAAEHLGVVAAVAYGEGTAEAAAWTSRQRHQLKHGSPQDVLAELGQRLAHGPRVGASVGPNGEAPAAILAREVAYFQKRAAQIAYAAFRAQGYPIGSGIVESGHKVVIGPRFKGAGQHWASAHLNPLLVLRTISCNGRWQDTWPRVWRIQEREGWSRRRHAQQRRLAAHEHEPGPAPTAAAASPVLPPVPAAPEPAAPKAPTPLPPRRPAASHPWRRPCVPPALWASQRSKPKI